MHHWIFECSVEFPQKTEKRQKTKKRNNYCDINSCCNKMPVGHMTYLSIAWGLVCTFVHRTIGKKRTRENLAQRAMGPLDPMLGLVNRGLVCTFVPSATSHPLRLPRGAHLLNFVPHLPFVKERLLCVQLQQLPRWSTFLFLSRELFRMNRNGVK